MKNDAALLIVTFVWGFTFVMVKESLSFVGPFTFLFYRFSLSFLLLIAISMKKLRKINIYVTKYGILIGIFLFSGYGFQTVGLQYTTPASAGFITGLSVVIVPFLSMALLKKRPGKNSLLGVLCAFLGLLFLSFQQLRMNYGDFLVLLCAFSFAMHIVLVGKFAPFNDPFLLTTVQIGTVAGLSFLFRKEQDIILNSTVLEALIITALFATVMAFLIQNIAQRSTPPTRTAVIFAMEPVFAAVSSFVLIHEVFTLRKIIGCLLILSGMVITEMKRENSSV